MKRFSNRIEKLEASRGRGGRVDPVAAAKAESVRLVNTWHRAFNADGGDRGPQMLHDHHARAVNAADDVRFENRVWRAALGVASGWSFVVVDGKATPIRFDVEKFERDGGGPAMLRAFAAEAERWKAASRHSDRCVSCRVLAARTRRSFA